MKHIVYTILFAILVVQAFSQDVDEKTARIVAEHFFLKNYGHKASVENVLVKQYKGHESLFFCNMDKGGWVAVPANRNLNPVVAHSDEGSVDLDNAPQVFLDWMEQYEFVVDVAMQEKWHKEDRHKKWDELLDEQNVLKSYVNHTRLLSTRWGQGCTNYDSICPGYNSLMPNSIYCGQGSCYKCPAGCGSVAMAQIANYWGFSYGNYVDFDWWDMADSLYSGNPHYLEEQIAISYLMRMIGYKNNTFYCDGGCESSATKEHMASGFVQMGYKNDIQIYQKKWFVTYNSWLNDLINEIEHERPLLYLYNSPSGVGHAFVCEGHNSSNDNFYFNLGWNGKYNMWIDFEDLFDEIPYINNGGTHYCIVNIRPDVQQDVTLTNEIISTTGSSAANKTYQTKGSISVAGNNTTFNILDSSKCRFVAKDSIVLKPGFHAHQGTSLLCKIYKKATLKDYNNSIVGTATIEDDFIKNSDNIVIFPNPVNDIITIKCNDMDENNFVIYIYNILGNEIENIHSTKKTISIDIANYPTGTYVVHIRTAKNEYSKTFIKL